jgi:hypothetical protein
LIYFNDPKAAVAALDEMCESFSMVPSGCFVLERLGEIYPTGSGLGRPSTTTSEDGRKKAFWIRY